MSCVFRFLRVNGKSTANISLNIDSFIKVVCLYRLDKYIALLSLKSSYKENNINKNIMKSYIFMYAYNYVKCKH